MAVFGSHDECSAAIVSQHRGPVVDVALEVSGVGFVESASSTGCIIARAHVSKEPVAFLVEYSVFVDHLR